MKLPRTQWPIWLLTLALVIGYPVLSFRQINAMARAGEFPPESDTIIIGLAGVVVFSIVAGLLVLLATALSLRKYFSETRLFA
ncbi:hypothetical protein [Qipengyuania sp. JC766]|uniref:hypothetical protein n=1 Tax=Qipengyuania sp. JC766 TaxID=3232139 RepID=UPI0034589C26